MADIPVVAMIIRSGWFGRVVLLILAVESLVAWAVIFNRLIYLGKCRRLNRRFRLAYGEVQSIFELEKPGRNFQKAPLAVVGKAVAQELHRIRDDVRSVAQPKEWSFFLENQFAMVDERLASILSQLSSQFDRWTYLLAVISSSAPFIGLLGTIWGIMDAFYQIGNQGSASLPVVAPGIAEALITTAIALLVAIPAAISYNVALKGAEDLDNDIYEFKDILLARLRREVMGWVYSTRS